jgi:hypothetical protein
MAEGEDTLLDDHRSGLVVNPINEFNYTPADGSEMIRIPILDFLSRYKKVYIGGDELRCRCKFLIPLHPYEHLRASLGWEENNRVMFSLIAKFKTGQEVSMYDCVITEIPPMGRIIPVGKFDGSQIAVIKTVELSLGWTARIPLGGYRSEAHSELEPQQRRR